MNQINKSIIIGKLSLMDNDPKLWEDIAAILDKRAKKQGENNGIAFLPTTLKNSPADYLTVSAFCDMYSAQLGGKTAKTIRGYVSRGMSCIRHPNLPMQVCWQDYQEYIKKQK